MDSRSSPFRCCVQVYQGSIEPCRFDDACSTISIDRIEEEHVLTIYETTITAAPSLETLIRPVSSMLLDFYLGDEASNTAKTQARRLLSQIHQRQPALLHSAVDQIVSDDEESKNAAEQLVISLSLVSMLIAS